MQEKVWDWETNASPGKTQAEYQQIFPRLLAKAEGDLAKGDLLSIPVRDVYLCSYCEIL